MQRILALLPLVALLAPMADGQDAASRRERFQLFNACRPTRLLIEGLSDEAGKIGLTEENLQVAAESRLRAARLYTEDWRRADSARLYVNVNVVGRAFAIDVYYEKRVSDAFGGSGLAINRVRPLSAPRPVPSRVPARQRRGLRLPGRPALGTPGARAGAAPGVELLLPANRRSRCDQYTQAPQ